MSIFIVSVVIQLAQAYVSLQVLEAMQQLRELIATFASAFNSSQEHDTAEAELGGPSTTDV